MQIIKSFLRSISKAGSAKIKGHATLSAGANITLTQAGNNIEIASTGGGISDGDKGDITVSGSGTVLTIDADAVTYSKIQDVSATDKLLGRSTSGAGNVEEITCTAAGRALLDDADATAQRATLGLGTLATQNGTFSGTSSGTNTGDQTSIVGISGTKSQFDTALTDGNFLYVGDVTQYTDEMAQDAVGTILVDSSEIDFTYNDATLSITASIVANSIDESKLDASVNASLDLADTSLQPSDLITELNANNWKVFYSDGAGDVTELALGASGQVLTSNGASSAPSFQAGGGGGVTLGLLNAITTAAVQC